MKETYIQKIKEKCIEANRDILKLKFGCKVSVYIPEYGEQNESTSSDYSPEEWGIATYIEPSEPMSYLEGKHIYDVYGSDFKNGNTEYVDEEDRIVCEILGRDITLADVLLAIKKLICDECNGNGGRLINGGYSECNSCGGDKYLLPEDFIGTGFDLTIIINIWDLKLPMHEQSEETLKFISELLS